MLLQGFFARIPLFLSFPTIILSSHLIIPTPQDIFFEKGINFIQLEAFVRLILIPLFVSTSFTAVGCLFSVIDETINDTLSVLFFSFILSQLNYLLNPIQSTCLSLLTLKLVLANPVTTNNSSVRRNVLMFCKSYGALLFLGLMINIGSDFSTWLTHIPFYIISFFALRYIHPILKLFNSRKRGNATQTDNIDTKKKSNVEGKFQVLLLVGPVVSFFLLYLVSRFYQIYQLQYLMVFVFLGCVTIFFLSFQDVSHIYLEQNKNEQDLSYSIYFPNYTIFTVGIVTIALQYLSFNSIASDVKTAFLTLIFVILSEYTSRFSEFELNKSKSQLHAHEHSHSHSAIIDHSNDGIFKQMVTNKDTRSIFSFLLLNTAFMFVQLLYSFRSKSLGLLSDSLHMALDCTSLFLGLAADILSKRPSYDKFPFGLNYLETLAGFTNGVVLLGIVCGIFVEAIGRIFNPVHIEGTNELLVVAILGLLVNLVGLFAFDHSDDSSSLPVNTQNDNMRGIFLHILADTLGSVGVIFSTILIKFTHWHICDPLASIFIALLILLSSIPLIKSTASSILLRLDDKKHNLVKNALNQISKTPGITGYTTPRFWPIDPNPSSHSHSHAHTHSHAHSHTHEEKGEEEGECHSDHHDDHDTNKKTTVLMGYIHIQYHEGENSTIIKKRVEKIFQNFNIQAWIQVESQNSQCWCRATSMSNQVVIQSVTKNT
ncbi:hypothetical protein KAFR_0B06250 [Kazachstania africana CBS 2517]|uniref:Zinc transporter n=1 Tax=Kazachstania africana (strain ATCC 22294 / BCRC 22015 / CBS 2517 / CECT 1963 / NBRC 1671 / NRRL Y-8276) TaxID=1071382 RepID=H2ARC2_KAZAF|nr:hypothetical protein KAFR_0B06250 [Kazachstania africana CBS 2517]CCF56922.1 hypothetical protein KAFR_0B06250 [Kazachstania africana CBS 2517]